VVGFWQLSSKEEERALAIHNESVIVDGVQSSNFTDEYFRIVKNAGVTASIVTVAWKQNLRDTLKLIWGWRKKLDRNKDVAVFAESVDDIHRAKRERTVAYLFGFQNTSPLEGDVDLLEIFKDLGVGIIQLTYNDKNIVGCGCGEKNDTGLTSFGVKVIETMNKLRLLVDLSHAGDRTTAEAIELAEFPVFSHANARTVCDNARNKTDEQIKAIVAKGGIIGINAYPSFVKRTRTEIGERPSVCDLLGHIDYVVKLVGIDYVGLAFDFIENATEEEFALLASNPEMWGLPNPHGKYEFPMGIEGILDVINITRGLIVRGYSDDEIRKITGENWLRVLRKKEGRIA
jgi:membrane dipeptidase